MGFKCNVLYQCYFLVTIVNACWWKTIWECSDSPSPTCGNVFESQYIILICFYFHALPLVASPRLGLQHNSINVYVIMKNNCNIILKYILDLQIIDQHIKLEINCIQFFPRFMRPMNFCVYDPINFHNIFQINKIQWIFFCFLHVYSKSNNHAFKPTNSLLKNVP